MSSLSKYLIRPIATSTKPSTEYQKQLEAYQAAVKLLDDLPSAQPEQKHGWWIETESDEPCFYRCSECKRMVDEDFRFCPNCGADMRGEQDG